MLFSELTGERKLTSDLLEDAKAEAVSIAKAVAERILRDLT